MTDTEDRELKTIKFQMMLSPSEAEAIDTWSFSNRIRSRAEAIRRLCQMGIIADDKKKVLVEGLDKHATAVLELSKKTRSAKMDENNGVDAAMDNVIIPFTELFRELSDLGIALSLLAEGDSITDSIAQARDIMAELK